MYTQNIQHIGAFFPFPFLNICKNTDAVCSTERVWEYYLLSEISQYLEHVIIRQLVVVLPVQS